MTISKRALLVSLVVLLAGGVTASTAGATRVATASVAKTSNTIPKAQCAANRAAGKITFVSPFGYDASVGILDVFAAESLGYFATECLNVAFVTNDYTVNETVSSGAGTVTGEGSAADALLAIAQGSSFVGVSTFGDTSDYAILTQPSITKLTELEGKTLGYHTVLPVVLTEMLKAAHVDIAKVKEVNDTSYDPDLLIQGEFNGLQAYQSNEPLTLKSQGHKFNEFKPAQFGVSGTFNVQVFNRSFLALHPAAAADFIRAELHAYDYCTKHEMACIDIEEKDATSTGSTYDVAHELAEWQVETGLVKAHSLPGKGVGVQSTAEWAPETKALVKAGLVKAKQIPSWAEDTKLAASLYHGTTLIWPGG